MCRFSGNVQFIFTKDRALGWCGYPMFRSVDWFWAAVGGSCALRAKFCIFSVPLQDRGWVGCGCLYQLFLQWEGHYVWRIIFLLVRHHAEHNFREERNRVVKTSLLRRFEPSILETGLVFLYCMCSFKTSINLVCSLEGFDKCFFRILIHSILSLPLIFLALSSFGCLAPINISNRVFDRICLSMQSISILSLPFSFSSIQTVPPSRYTPVLISS